MSQGIEFFLDAFYNIDKNSAERDILQPKLGEWIHSLSEGLPKYDRKLTDFNKTSRLSSFLVEYALDLEESLTKTTNSKDIDKKDASKLTQVYTDAAWYIN